MKIKSPKKLIEVNLPLKEINEATARAYAKTSQVNLKRNAVAENRCREMRK